MECGCVLTTVYTFRYFLTEWYVAAGVGAAILEPASLPDHLPGPRANPRPHLTLFVFPTPSDTEPIATIICKQAMHRERTDRGYIGMLSVTHKWRRRGIARKLVELAIAEMRARGAQEVRKTMASRLASPCLSPVHC